MANGPQTPMPRKKRRIIVTTERNDDVPQSVMEIAAAVFDEEYYMNLHPEVEDSDLSPLEHYCQVGWREGFDPSPKFSTTAYLSANADVHDAGLNPLLHYIEHGRREGRKVFPARASVAIEDGENTRAMLARHFDPVFYAKKYPDVALATSDLLAHYMIVSQGVV